MSDNPAPCPAQPVLDYQPPKEYLLQLKNQKSPIGMRGPNILITVGMGLIWYSFNDRYISGLVLNIFGGFCVLAGFKAHVVDVVKAYSWRRYRSEQALNQLEKIIPKTMNPHN